VEDLVVIHVIAVITAEPGKRQAILDELAPLMPTIHAEPGCLEYTVTIDAGLEANTLHQPTAIGPDTFLVVEKWESLEALRAHSAAPHVHAYFEKVGAFMAGRVVHFLTSVA
jgi:quinol monooxygenase YgiN